MIACGRSLVVLSMLVIACGAQAPASRDPTFADPLASVRADELARRGRLFAARGDHSRALEYYRAAIQRGMPADRIAPSMIESAVASQRYREALQLAAPILERDPNNWRLRYLVANLYLGLGEVRPAEEELDRLVEIAPDESEPHYLLAQVIGDQAGRAAEARPLYERYVALAPNGEHAATARRWLAAHAGAPADSRPPADAIETPAPTTKADAR